MALYDVQECTYKSHPFFHDRFRIQCQIGISRMPLHSHFMSNFPTMNHHLLLTYLSPYVNHHVTDSCSASDSMLVFVRIFQHSSQLFVVSSDMLAGLKNESKEK